LRKRRPAEAGASAIEYGVLVAAVAAFIAVIVFALGSPTLGLYHRACESWASSDPASQTTC
jgi:pilus assembly protein Flp/PilA